MEMREVTAKSVEEAIELALKELGARREEVEVEVLSRGKAGFLGIGAEPARVRVRRLTTTESPASLAMEVMKRLLSAAGVTATATLRSAQDPETGGPIIDIGGDDSGLLIGRRGETLRALQFLVNLLVNKQLEKPVRVGVDVEQYRERRYKALKELALRVAERAVASGRAITLEPMPSAERRIVHLALANHPQVTTQSIGFGSSRKVAIIPKKAQPH
jgi:spoIIIJ-associated protein